MLRGPSSDALIAVLTLVVATLAARDAIWQSNRSAQLFAFIGWVLVPIGADASSRFVDGGSDPELLRGIVLAATAWVIISTAGRPAMIMMEWWPEELQEDERLRRSGVVRTAIFIGGIVGATVIAVVLILTGLVWAD